mgnify:CR=1 FL=1
MNTLIAIIVGLLIAAAVMYPKIGHMFKKPDNDVIRWFNATHAVLLCITTKTSKSTAARRPKENGSKTSVPASNNGVALPTPPRCWTWCSG